MVALISRAWCAKGDFDTGWVNPKAAETAGRAHERQVRGHAYQTSSRPIDAQDERRPFERSEG